MARLLAALAPPATVPSAVAFLILRVVVGWSLHLHGAPKLHDPRALDGNRGDAARHLEPSAPLPTLVAGAHLRRPRPGPREFLAIFGPKERDVRRQSNTFCQVAFGILRNMMMPRSVVRSISSERS
jgi:uncharacterized membrane protein YphA (DoxX/SURF4 family)